MTQRSKHTGHTSTQKVTPPVVAPELPDKSNSSSTGSEAMETSAKVGIDEYEPFKEAASLAFPLAIDAYIKAERRLDVVEKRLQDLMAFAVSITLGALAFIAGKVDLTTWPFKLSLFCTALGLLIGIPARLRGS